MRIPISLICLNASRMSSLCEAGFFRERNEVRAHCLHRSFLWRGPTCRCGGNLPRLIFSEATKIIWLNASFRGHSITHFGGIKQ